MGDRNIIKEWTPLQLGLSQKDLNAADATEYSSPVLDLTPYANFLVSLKTDVTGAVGAGVAKLHVELYADDETTQLGADIDLLTAIDTQADRNELVAFGRDFAGVKDGNGTIGANINMLRMLRRARVVLTVVTQSDAATSNVADVRLQAQPLA